MQKQRRQPKPVRLLQISDTHCYSDDNSRLEWSEPELYPNQSLIRLLAHLKKRAEDFDALVVSGDLVQEESAAAYRRVGEILQDFPLPVYTLPGNHDIPELLRTELVMACEQVSDQFHARFEDWHCLFLNTHAAGRPEGHMTPEQFFELEVQLDQIEPDEYAMLFMHHHPVPIGSPWMDRMGLQQADEFWLLLAKYPQVKAVSFGHVHSEFNQHYQLSEGRVVHTFSTPATCVQVKHIDEQLRFDHFSPAWRELSLFANGQLETRVHYLVD
ncbi:MAG: metallophosphoesterase [Thiolinea sp.]